MINQITSQFLNKSPICIDNGSICAALLYNISSYDNDISFYTKGVSIYQAALINIYASVTGRYEIKFSLASDDLYIANINGIHIYKYSDQSYSSVSSKAYTFVLGLSND